MTIDSAAKASAVTLIALSAMVLAAHAFGTVLSLMFPPPWSCVGFAAAGVSLWLGARRSQSLGTVLPGYAAGALVLSIGIVSWGEYIAGANSGFDALLFPSALLTTVPHPGRPAPATGFNFFLLGLGLLLMQSRRALAALLREGCAITSITFCYLGLIGFLTNSGRGPATHEVMVPLVATMFLIASATILLSAPGGHLLSLLRGSGPAGIFARWLMPVPLILPALTALARSAGQKLGLFDVRGSGSILSFVDILAAILIVWGSSSQVMRVDKLRRRAEEDLRSSRDELDLRVRLRTGELEAEIAVRTRAEVELQLTNATLSNVIETSPLAICAFNIDGTVRKRNAAAEAILAAETPEFRALIDRAARGESIAAMELTRASAQGPPMHLHVWASPLLVVDGRPDGVLMIAVDVSERKAFEAQLRQAQKLESLGVLAGGIAHDFNNLLTGILGNASLVLDTLGADHVHRPMLDQVVVAARRAADLTSQMLAYAGKGQFVLQQVSVSDLVGEITGLIHASISKTVHLRLRLSENIPLIEADASQIRQVVMNLVINGSESILKSGTVAVETGWLRLDRSYVDEFLQGSIAPGTYVCLQVSDTGTGMDEETRARMFDPFFTTKFTGRGLGLAAVQGIVRGHKGALQVQSALNSGTTFKLFFPVSGAAREAEALAPARLQKARGSGTILVIDDELIVRQTARSALERIGFRVELAETGQEAIRMFSSAREPIAAILLDLTMPGLSGQETFCSLHVINPDVPVILSSGYNELEAVRYFNGERLAGFIQKPYTASQLAARVEAVLRNTA